MKLAPLIVAIVVSDPAAWRTIRELPAPEAHQAAAADRDHFYAISSTQVARYDRKSGQRIAVSEGPAEHLNSGFLHEGILYCAHSNYPKLPERSEIKALDLRSMRLTTFHDFGNFGGSLTWCVLREGHWWCHFARYGDANRESFLVEFDGDWRELRRWTWPRDVLDRIGRQSLSGGVWQGETLVATGHDDPVLFRVRLPEEGSELRFVRTEVVPFTGQGIAHDPVTEGLIGISRREKKLILAAPPAP